MCDAGGGTCNAAREMWGYGDDGVLRVVLAEGLCLGYQQVEERM